MNTSTPSMMVRLMTDGRPDSPISDVAAFLWDLSIVYDRLFLGFSGDHRFRRRRQNFANRAGRRIVQVEDRLKLHSARSNTPFVFELWVPALATSLGAGWGLVKILNGVLEARLKILQIENTKLNIHLAKRELEKPSREVGRQMPATSNAPQQPPIVDSNQQESDFAADEIAKYVPEPEPWEIIAEDAAHLVTNPSVGLVKVEEMDALRKGT